MIVYSVTLMKIPQIIIKLKIQILFSLQFTSQVYDSHLDTLLVKIKHIIVILNLKINDKIIQSSHLKNGSKPNTAH